MALPTIGVLDKDAVPQTINTANSGRQAAADSQAVVLSTEDKADLAAILAKIIAAPATEAKQDTGNTSLASLVASLTTVVPVGGLSRKTTFVPSMLAALADAGDVVAATETIASFFRQINGTGLLTDLVIVDGDDQKAELYIWLFDTAVTFGTEGLAPSISDADAATCLGKIHVEAADYTDLGGVSVAHKQNLATSLKSLSGAATIAVAIHAVGTPTFTASGLTLRFGWQED